ncbi:MAG: TonB-dependent receptor [Lacunisphaera sp.]|nr:TonB-dependent receptor [Lacunisphaera sp.]
MSFPNRFLSLSLLLASAAVAVSAQTVPATPAPASTAAVALDPFVVTGQLDTARESIVPSLGATSYEITQQQIETISQGANAPFTQILLRAPGVAADSAGSGGLHVRGEHANLQFRINDVLLPEGISGFGLELDPRFVGSLQLVTGSLPAQYGFRTAGVVDIHTKSGTIAQGGDASVYGGSFDTIRPAFETGGSSGNLSYYVSGSYNHSGIGIENPTASSTAVHDTTDQSKLFAYFSYVLDQGSRLSLMAGASDSDFQVPNTPGLDPGTSPNGNQWLPGTFDSAALNENQKEQNYYAIAAYQKSAGNLNYQLSAFGRESKVHFTPDPLGDLFFNGVASDIARKLTSAGVQADFSYVLGDSHTVRGGASVLHESVSADASTTVFPVDANGDPTGPRFAIADRDRLHGLFAGLYLQDEWKAAAGLTVNYGVRFDVFNSSFDDEQQLSPRINFIYQASKSTTLHAGYARYFTPPPVENVSGSTVAQFDGTSNASALDQDDPVKAERSDYFDAGISQKIAPGFTFGVDGYYKRAKNQLDDGLFGQTLILSAFNYAKGEIYGLEFTASYTNGGFAAYANLAHSVAKGKDWNSAQFLFDPADLAYVQSHSIFLDHDQSWTGSSGISYRWTETSGSTLLYVDGLYGSGLRNDGTAADGSTIPNGATVPSYVTFNLGAERSFKAGPSGEWKVRIDVVNLADKVYELRDGSGVGVNAAQFGMRRGFFGSISYKF